MKAIVVVRPLDGKSPQVPASWDNVYQTDDWTTVWPRGRENDPDTVLFCWLAVSDAGQGAFVVCGPDAWLRAIHESAARAWTIAELRSDSGAIANRIKSLWKDDRENGQGDLVGLRRTIAGFDIPGDLERTGELP